MADRTRPRDGAQDGSEALVDAALARLARPLWLTRLGLLAERAARAFWPAWVILSFALAALAFLPQAALTADLLRGIGTVALLALGLALGLGLRRFRWPSRAEAAARLDASLAGRPLAAVTDRQATGAGDGA
ncbi:MAG: ATPase, partial [Alphaproteobacteria bacterium HGW-Alphaproteobacteria-2]